MAKEIVLNNGMVAIVDDEDYEWISQWKWSYSTKGYAQRSTYSPNNPSKKTSLKMHRVILGVTNPKVMVDHINGNKLDNRRSNLRIVDGTLNNANQKPKGQIKYRGVYYNKDNGKFRATITKYGKRKHLGYFDTPEEAAQAYNEAALFYFGDYARLNEIDEWGS